MAGSLGGSWWNPIDNIIAQGGRIAGQNSGADATTSEQAGNYVAGIDQQAPQPQFIEDRLPLGNLTDTLGVNTTNQNNYNTGPTAEQIAAQKQQAEWDRQINSINQNLGVYAPRLAGGLSDIDRRFDTSKTRLGDQRTSAMTGYDDQNNLALQGRTRGYEQVDNYANKSANSLSRIFQGANAGNSSVARLLAPKLVGQASDSRRMDVTETANQNLGGIKKARDEANSQFDFAVEDNENNRGYEREAFEKGITQEEIGQYNERARIEREAGRDASDSQANVDRRMGRLGELFGAGRFQPNYQAKAVNPQAVSLNDYRVDPMSLKLGQQQQGGSFYAPQLKKKNELRVR